MQPRAKDFRFAARTSLSGYWGTALLTSFVGVLLGGTSASFSTSGIFEVINNFYYTLPMPFSFDSTALSVLSQILLNWGLVVFLIGGAIELGIWAFFGRINMGERPPFSALFERFALFGKALGLRLFISLFVFLWSLLFIIPGIVASYKYSLAPQLMAEYPQMGIREAVNRSKQLMSGHKGRLFCLDLSFIGWWFLSALTLGILGLWITPYFLTARAAFYLNRTGRAFGIGGPQQQ